ncbi:MAG: flagellin [Fimbriimonadales bacterium]|nr:flagellin [Fimbriimonadales bacterium]
MSLRINTNIQSQNALRNVSVTSDLMGRTIERLASGLRVNRAADDPAGLIISENLRAQITGLQQAVNNAQDAVNMIKTAEAALDEVHNALRTMRQLVLHAANTGVNDYAALQADQTQIRALIDSINRIAEQTSFGTKKLLDGTSGISAAITNPTRIAGIFIGGIFNNFATDSGAITLQVTTAATRATVIGTRTFAAGTTLASLMGTPAGNVVINGYTITADANETVGSFIDKINAVSHITGVVANFNVSTLQIELRHKEYGSQFEVNLHDTAGIILNGPNNQTATGVDAIATVVANTVNGIQTVTFTGGLATGDSGLRLRDGYGNVITLTEAGNDTSLPAAQVAVVSAGLLQFQVGANAGQFVRFSLMDVNASKLGTTVIPGQSLATIDITQPNSTDNALRIIDAAISEISKLRGDMGAFQRYILESNIRSLNVARENVMASESTIRDADFALEISNFTKQQILMQSGMSVLAQANSMPQTVLQLLQRL